MRRALLLLGLCLLCAAPAAAQAKGKAPAGKGRPAAAAPAPEIKLVYEREVYTYPGAAGRRDPFRPLTGENDAGPLFTELRLRSIMYMASSPGRSLATVVDGSNKLHRVRRGDVIGNATVLDIGRQRVLFSVEDFGVRRQEVLEMQTTTGRGRTR